ncbi:MAG TPA: calcium-binding protein [Ramlibacter sp.]|jgi:Ca2+-binding RTX toxin-like protein|nr:calcium-binding protein [Ramlibacter sp.]
MPLSFELSGSAFRLPDVKSPAGLAFTRDNLLVAATLSFVAQPWQLPHGQRLQAQVLDALGQQVDAGQVMGSVDWTAGSQAPAMRDAAVTRLADGRLLFAWEQALDAQGNRPAIRLVVYDTEAVGASLVGVVPLDPADHPWYTADLRDRHAVAQLGDGTLVLVAPAPAMPNVMGSPEDILVQLFTTGGSMVATRWANTTFASAQVGPAVAALGGTRYVVTWSDYSGAGEDTAPAAVRARIFEGANAVTPEILVNTTWQGMDHNSSVAALAGGGFVVAWESDAPDLTTAVRFQRFDAAGNRLGGETAVNTTGAAHGHAPAVHAFPDGSFVIAWVGTDPAGRAVFARSFGADGAPLQDALLLGTAASVRSHLHITEAPDGHILVSWGEGITDTVGRFLDNRAATQFHGTGGDDGLVGHDSGQRTSNDVLVAYAGDDRLYGLGGADYLYAGAGDDTAAGGAGTDVLLGDAGNDVLSGEEGDDYLYGGAGINQLSGGAGVDVFISEGTDTLAGEDGGDYFYATGGTFTQFAQGGEGNDIFVLQAGGARAEGGNGQDYFYLGAAADTMLGGAGVDVLIGQSSGGTAGAGDWFEGGAGIDYLFLTPGADTVRFGMQDEVDVVNGFDVASDVLLLDAAMQGLDVTAYDFGSYTILSFGPGLAIWLIGVAVDTLDEPNFAFA